ncbi:MAG: hypothetical protein HY922_10265 [Elusimicrobia bacterium]|nr:hypothetical protein [Elusimicrobiota bacterium]
MRLPVLLCAFFAAAPLGAAQVGHVQVAVPGASNMAGAVGARAQAGVLANPSLTNAGALSLTSNLAVPSLVPSVIPGAAALVLSPETQSYGAPSAAPQTVSALPLSRSSLAPADGSSFMQPVQEGASPVTAAQSLENLTAKMEAGRVSGRDVSNDLSNRFFDQSGLRGPPQAEPARVSDPAALKLPPGVTRVRVDTVRTAKDVDRYIPYTQNSVILKEELRNNVKRMAPYQVYTYYDKKGGSFTGIDLSARPELVDFIPELQQHEVRLIKKLRLVHSDIRVLVREDGKTPDLVIGDKLVELKSSAGLALPLESLIKKANRQVLEHGRRHGYGGGALALDLTREQSVPVARMQSMLDSWQANSRDEVVLEQVIVFGGQDMKVFVRQSDGTYRIVAPAVIAPRVVRERPLAPAEKVKAQAMLRNGIEKSPVLALTL